MCLCLCSSLAAVKIKQSWPLVKGSKSRFYSVITTVGERAEFSFDLHRGDWEDEGVGQGCTRVECSSSYWEVKTYPKSG